MGFDAKVNMELSLDNLDALKTSLTEACGKARTVLKLIDSDSVAILPESRQALNGMMDSASCILYRMAHVESFLETCEQNKALITPEQRECVSTCQQLCQNSTTIAKHIVTWVTQMKSQLNEAGCPVLDDLRPLESNHVPDPSQEAIITPDMLEMYQTLRTIFGEIHKDLGRVLNSFPEL